MLLDDVFREVFLGKTNMPKEPLGNVVYCKDTISPYHASNHVFSVEGEICMELLVLGNEVRLDPDSCTFLFLYGSYSHEITIIKKYCIYINPHILHS